MGELTEHAKGVLRSLEERDELIAIVSEWPFWDHVASMLKKTREDGGSNFQVVTNRTLEYKGETNALAKEKWLQGHIWRYVFACRALDQVLLTGAGNLALRQTQLAMKQERCDGWVA